MPGSPQKRARRAAQAAAQDVPAAEPTIVDTDEQRVEHAERLERRKQGHRLPPDADNDNNAKQRNLRPKVQCGHIAVASEQQCRSWAIRGSEPPRCRTHSSRQERDRALVAHELRQWRLGETHVDPAEMLLRLVSQSATRLNKLSNELGELVDDEGLQAALIGEVRVPSENGSYVSGDYIRGLARLESEERDRLAHFAKTALAAGLETRKVELAESQGRLMAQVLRLVLADPALGLSTDQLALVPGLLRRAQEQVIGPAQAVAPREIEGAPS